MYVIVWKYKVTPDSRENFEAAYGPEGSWADFFRKNEHYRGTCLFKSQQSEDTYLLMDFWKSKEAYEIFMALHGTQYQQLSLQFHRLYEAEEKVDAYEVMH